MELLGFGRLEMIEELLMHRQQLVQSSLMDASHLLQRGEMERGEEMGEVHSFKPTMQ